MWEHLADAIKDEETVELSNAALGYNQLALTAHEPKGASRNAGGVVDLHHSGSSQNRNSGPYLVFYPRKTGIWRAGLTSPYFSIIFLKKSAFLATKSRKISTCGVVAFSRSKTS
jgi:hypothetical protein